MFEDATFDSRSLQHSQSSQWMLVALFLNLGAVAATIALPLLYPESLPTRWLQRALSVPAAPAGAQQPHIPQSSTAAGPPRPMLYPILTASRPVILREPLGAAPAPVYFLDMGANWLGSAIPGATGDRMFPTSAPISVRPAPAAVARVSGGVIEGLLLSKTVPVYPAIARTAGVSGTVVLAATISKQGTIENLRVLTGSPLLTGAAIDAVKSWRYRPYRLNNEPMEVETTIQVVFSLANR